MPSDPNPFPQTERRGRRPRPVVFFFFLPALLLLGIAVLLQIQLVLALWGLLTLGLLMLGYGVFYDTQARLHPTHMTLRFHNGEAFRMHFIALMRRIGFDEQVRSDVQYTFELAPRSQIRIGAFAFPPQSWGRIEMEVSDNTAILTGAQLTITTVRKMIIHQLNIHDDLILPY